MVHVLYVVAEARYFKSHRLHLAREALARGFHVSLATHSIYDGYAEDKAYFEALGIYVYDLPIQRTSLNPLQDLKTLWALIQIIYQSRCTIVHNVALKPILYGSCAAKCVSLFTRRRIRIVNALSGLGYVFTSTTRRARVIRSLLQPVLAYAMRKTQVIVQNQTDRTILLTWGIPYEYIHLIAGAGVDTQIFSPSQSPELTCVLTFVSRMLWSKGVGEVLALGKRLKEEGLTQIILQLVGDPDPLNPDCVPESVLRDAHAQGSIRYVPHSDSIADVYRASHAALLPSYREGLPKSLIEACACGLPILTTTAPGCSDMIVGPVEREHHDIERGQNGWRVPVQSVDGLYHAVMELCSLSAKEYAAMCQSSREYALSELDQRIVNERTLCIYD